MENIVSAQKTVGGGRCGALGWCGVCLRVRACVYVCMHAYMYDVLKLSKTE